jgi:predicted CXXCH cytochrome family protein
MMRLLRVAGMAMLASAALSGAAAAQVPTGPPQTLFRSDVHARAGLTCETCHGRAVRGTYMPVKRTAIAPLCSHCHSDAMYMGRFVPKPRVDQYALYLKSTHGTQMAKGETRVATCTDCHGAHGVRTRQDPASPVAPLHVVATCARCHSDRERMDAFHLPDAPDDWRHSVHAAALNAGDLSAPTCSTCHSGHGPLPDGAARLDEVCWQCHVREADLYKASPKKKLFDETDHPGCVTCHEAHQIEKPADSFIGIKGSAVCAVCHDADMKGAKEIALVQQGLAHLTQSMNSASVVMDRAERAGMLVDDGRDALRDARERQIQARVAVHTFTAAPFSASANAGVKDAQRAERAAYDALAELQFRRKGLAVATVLIVGFLVTLWIKIRRLPPASE